MGDGVSRLAMTGAGKLLKWKSLRQWQARPSQLLEMEGFGAKDRCLDTGIKLCHNDRVIDMRKDTDVL